MSCTSAHEGGQYARLVPFTRLIKIGNPGPSPVEIKAQKEHEARDAATKNAEAKDAETKDKDDESTFDGMFDGLADRQKNMGDDNDAAPA